MIILGNRLQLSPTNLPFVPFISYVILNAGQMFSVYSTKIHKLGILYTGNTDQFFDIFSSWSWVVFTGTYLILGLFSVRKFLNFHIFETQNSQEGTDSLVAISRINAPTNFLSAFFKKESIVEDIHRRSVSENYKILEYFKGGSDAITMLIEKSSGLVVHKVTGVSGREKLIAQEIWLRNVQSKNVVKVLNSSSNPIHHQIELEYISDTYSLFDFIHKYPIDSTKKLILCLFEALQSDVYGTTHVKNIESDLVLYLEENFQSRLRKASSESLQLREILELRIPLNINSKIYFDLYTIIEKIIRDERCLQILTLISSSSKCHGDLTIDNILVRKVSHDPVVIDPSDDNLIKGPFYDMSRLMQSLLGGYEFLNMQTSDVEVRFEAETTYIKFLDMKSSQYTEIASWLYDEVFPRMLSKNEILSIKFHVGIFYSRMLTRRILIDEKTVIKYLAVSIQYLNEFYEDVASKHA